MTAEKAITRIRERAMRDRGIATDRWHAGVGSLTSDPIEAWADRFSNAGRLTLNFHPDRLTRDGRTVAAGLRLEGRYRSQWVTGISSGSRSAMTGGARERFERQLFDGAYDVADPALVELPIYGSLDLLFDDHGGSPRFGSSFVVLHKHVLERTTLSVGDSHMEPSDVATADEPWSVLAGLAEQAAGQRLLNRGLGAEVLLEALGGRYRSDIASRELDGYIEAQVHGGLSLAEDVEAIVLDPSFRGTAVADDVVAAAHQSRFELAYHRGSELRVEDVPADFRGPTMPALAREVARPDGVVDAHAIGARAAKVPYVEPHPQGDSHESELQQLKYLWHTLLKHGHDAEVSPR